MAVHPPASADFAEDVKIRAEQGLRPDSPRDSPGLLGSPLRVAHLDGQPLGAQRAQ